jgi:hypothetical protein
MLPTTSRSIMGLLLALAGTLVVAAADVAVVWAAANTLLVKVVWLGWQGATLALLIWSVPPSFQRLQSTFLREVAIVITVVGLHAALSLLGVIVIANARETFGIPI